MGKSLGEYGESIAAIEKRLKALEEAVPPTPSPEEKVVLRIGINKNFAAPDPPFWYTDLLNGLGQLVTEPLFLSWWENDEPSLKPLLVESYEITDELTWVFHLKKGIKFSDGSELTAKDVWWSLWGRQDPRPGNFLWSIDPRIESMEIVDTYTIKMVTKSPMADLTIWLSHGWTNIMSYEAVKRSGQENVVPIQGVENVLGTGPYMWEEIEPNLYAKMTLNPYWRGDRPQITNIEFYYLPDDEARVAALESGSVDFITPLPIVAIDMLEKKGFTIWEAPGHGLQMLSINNLFPPCDDIRVRQAMAYAINYDELLSTILGRAAERIYSPAPPVLGYKEVRIYDYNPEKARQLLSDAGYPDGITIKYPHYPAATAQADEIIAAIQGYFRDAGINLQVDIVERATWQDVRIGIRHQWLEDKSTEFLYHCYIWGWSSDTMFVGDDLFSTCRGEAASNYNFYSNPEVDELIEFAVSQAPLEERIKACEEAQQIYMEDCVLIPLYSTPHISVSTSAYTGHIILPNGYECFLEGRLTK
jgi:peptide/nickel transport system substrate-binding protein